MEKNLSFDELTDFLTELRAHGFVIGIDRFIAARTIFENTARGARASEAKLMTVLAPVLCSSPEEQETFYRLYLAWLDRRARAAALANESGSIAGSVIRFFRGPRFALHRRVIIVLLALAGAATLLYQDELFSPLRKEPRILRSPPPVPVHPLQQSAAPTTGTSATTASDDARGKAFAPVDLVVPAAPDFFERHYTAVKMGAAFLPLVAVALWFRLAFSRRRQLERKTAPDIPSFVTLRFASAAADLFADAEFRRARRALRRHRRTSASELNLAATVESTLRTGGWFSPVHAVRNMMPEYLVLIERAGESDQQARYFDRLVDALVEEGVYLERFHFRGSVRTCTRADEPHAPVALAELRVRYPEHRLVIFSDGAGFFNPIDDTPHRWLDELNAWGLRALMTPETFDLSDAHQRALRETGMIVLPARPDGIIRLSTIVSAQVVDARRWVSPSYPLILREQPERFLAGVRPDPPVVTSLFEALREFLGDDGYDWLAACAVFPTVEWELTLHLGSRLLNRGDMERLLPSLVRLPWLRHGVFPEWFRTELVASLTDAGLDRMRAIFEELLRGRAAARGNVEFRMAAELLPDREPRFYDYIASTVLKGRRPKPKAVAIPLALRRILAPNDPDRMELRPFVMSTLAIVCLGVMLYLALKPMPTPIAPSATVSPSVVHSGSSIEISARGTPKGFFEGADLFVPGAAEAPFRDVRATLEGLTAVYATTASTKRDTIDVEIRRDGAVIGSFRLEVREQSTLND